MAGSTRGKVILVSVLGLWAMSLRFGQANPEDFTLSGDEVLAAILPSPAGRGALRIAGVTSPWLADIAA